MPDDLNVIKRSVSKPDRLTSGTETYAKMCAYRDQLERHGYVHISGRDMLLLTGYADISPLLEAADEMPLDPYGGGMRRRFYRTATFFPWNCVCCGLTRRSAVRKAILSLTSRSVR